MAVFIIVKYLAGTFKGLEVLYHLDPKVQLVYFSSISTQNLYQGPQQYSYYMQCIYGNTSTNDITTGKVSIKFPVHYYNYTCT